MNVEQDELLLIMRFKFNIHTVLWHKNFTRTCVVDELIEQEKEATGFVENQTPYGVIL